MISKNLPIPKPWEAVGLSTLHKCGIIKPMTLPKTIGHEKQKRYFEQARDAGRLAHAYAFVGEPGIGKTSFALELAREIFGAEPTLDTFLLGESEPMRVEDARNLQNLLALTPAGKSKVAILNADTLDAEAASALLKTLEEPPARSVLILVVSNFYKVLPTIASRVQKIVFGRVSDEQISAILDQYDLDTSRKQEILSLADGRIGLAKRLTTDETFFVSMKSFAEYFETLKSLERFKRLQTSARLAELETDQLHDFVRFGMRKFAIEPFARPQLGQKLVDAWRDLGANVNVRLALDNLFL